MKNILIVMPTAMSLGGIETSLLGLLDAMDYNEVSVDLFIYGHHGELFRFINKNVNILPENRELAFIRNSFKLKLKHRAFRAAWFRIQQAIKHFDIVEYDYKVISCMPKIEKQYDLALSFFRPFNFIKDKVNARIKVGWIHTDYSVAPENIEVLKKDYGGLDYIAAVSEGVRQTFCNLFPEFESKTIVVENILSRKFVEKRSFEFDVSNEMPKDSEVRFLSVGRFGYAKNFDNIPEICSLICEKGFDVKWYIIGYGDREELIRKKIQEFGMQKKVIILGKRENPYPYIKECDIYIQPSRYEGKSVAVREAQMLGKPVIITEYPTAYSQIANGEDGIIIPLANNLCASHIIKVLETRELIDKIVLNCQIKDFSSKEEINKIYSLLT